MDVGSIVSENWFTVIYRPVKLRPLLLNSFRLDQSINQLRLLKVAHGSTADLTRLMCSELSCVRQLTEGKASCVEM